MPRDRHRTLIALVLGATVFLAAGATPVLAASAQPSAAHGTDADLVRAPHAVGDDASVAATSNQTQQNTSNVRALHVSPVLPAIDVLVDGQPIVTNLSFIGITEYQPVEAGNASVTIRVNETGSVVYEDTVTFTANDSYTVLGAGSVDANGSAVPEPAVLQDDFDVPSDENAAVRFLHAVPDAPAVTVTLDPANESLGDVTFRNATDYAVVPAGDYTVLVRPAGDDIGEVLAQRNVTVGGGTVYTAVAFGFFNVSAAPPDAALPLLIALTEDANATAQVAISENETTAAGAGNETNATVPAGGTSSADATVAPGASARIGSASGPAAALHARTDR
jgi:hypothetical protein